MLLPCWPTVPLHLQTLIQGRPTAVEKQQMLSRRLGKKKKSMRFRCICPWPYLCLGVENEVLFRLLLYPTQSHTVQLPNLVQSYTHTILRTKEYYLMLLVCSLVSLPLSCVCACKFSCFMSLWQVWHSWGKKTSKNKTNSKAKSNFLNSYWHTAKVIIHWLFSREFAKNSVQTRASYVHPIPNDVLSMLPVRRIHPQLRSARVIFASCVAPPEETLSRKIDLSMELSCNSRCA